MGVPAKKIFAAAQSSPTARACCGAKRSPTKASTRFARVDAAVATGTLDGPGGGFDPDTMDDSFDPKMLMPPMKHSCNSARVLKRVAPTTVARADGLADAFGDIGKRIKVRFNLKRKPGVKRFYNGTIVDYDKESRSHTIAYDDGDLTKYPSLKKKTFQISAAPASAIPATPEVESATAQASEGPEATLLLAQDRGTWDDGDVPCFSTSSTCLSDRRLSATCWTTRKLANFKASLVPAMKPCSMLSSSSTAMLQVLHMHSHTAL